MVEITIREAVEDADLAQIHSLFSAYAYALNFDLCFQGFDQELATLPGSYAPPSGALWLAYLGRETVGCIGLRPLTGKSCEMKRLYVAPAARGHGLGRRLAEKCLAAATKRGYWRLYLDTMRQEMKAAGELYRDLGFRQVAPYYDDPIPGVVCYARDLAG